MYQSINFNGFTDAFKSYNRNDNFSYHGLKALYDYFEELEESTGKQIEMDVIAIACDYTEYDSLEKVKENYSDIENMEDLKDHTTVIEFNGGIIISDF